MLIKASWQTAEGCHQLTNLRVNCMMSKRVGETTIKTSIRIRPCSQQEKETFPGPSPVQAAPGEVRLFQRSFAPGSGRNRYAADHMATVSVLRSSLVSSVTSPAVSLLKHGWLCCVLTATHHAVTEPFQKPQLAHHIGIRSLQPCLAAHHHQHHQHSRACQHSVSTTSPAAASKNMLLHDHIEFRDNQV